MLLLHRILTPSSDSSAAVRWADVLRRVRALLDDQHDAEGESPDTGGGRSGNTSET
jgi:hypothetical protein